jgi:hypothetical protein
MKFINSYKFRSNLFYGGELLTGDMIEITGKTITLKRNRWFFHEYYSISIPLTNIINVQISKHGSGAEIKVESHSKNLIISKGYKYSSACKIKQLILQNITVI